MDKNLDIKETVAPTISREPELGSIEPVNSSLSWFEQFKLLGKSRHAVYACLACSSGAILTGYDLNLMGSIIANSEFVKTFGVYDASTDAWVLSASRQLVWSIVQFVSAICGAVTCGMVSDRFGRRICYYILIILTMIGTLVELFSPDWKVWIVGKLLFGLAMGFMQANIPGYVSELAPVHIRGFMLSLFQFWIVTGSFLSSCVLEGTSNIDGQWSWKSATVTQWGVGLISVLFFVFLVPESPYFLVNHGRIDKVRAVLQKLRGKEEGYSVEVDLQAIRDTVEHEKIRDENEPSYIDCFKGTDRRRTLLACLPMVMQQFCGFALAGNYLSYFLELSGVSQPFLITAISCLLSMFAVLLSFTLIEYVGRRPQLLGGVSINLLCLLALGILGFVNRGSAANNQALAGIAIIWNIFYYIALGAVGWTIVGEISSTRLRAKTSSIAVSVNALVNMCWAIAVPYLINADEANLGPKSGFIFLGTGLFFTLIAFFCLPETKNKTFDELDRLFEDRTPARKF